MAETISPVSPPSEAEGVAEVEKQLKAEQDRVTNEEFDKLRKQELGDHAEEYSKIKQMGFVSKKDLEDTVAKVNQLIEKQQQEYQVLKEMLLRAKTQGKAVIPAQEQQDPLKEVKDLYKGILPL